MAWYNFWKKKVVFEQPVEEELPKEVPLSTPVTFVHTPKSIYRSDWRNGMWVMTKKGIGIVFKLGYMSEVHLVNELGETIGATLEHQQAMRQATLAEIPKSRKVGLSVERAAQLGYM